MGDPAIPPESGRFFGRRAELRAVAALLATGQRLVTVTGQAGIGKTRLCLHVARQLPADALPGGIFFCDLTHARSCRQLLEQLGTTLAVDLPGDADQHAATISAALAQRPRSLTLLDNLDRLVAEPAVWTALTRHDALFLATRRDPLGVAQEALVPLGPLSTEEAHALFADRSTLAVAPDEADAVQSILLGLDRNPLAIEIAAAHVDVLGPVQLRDQLTLRMHLLEHPRGDLPARSRSLEGALEVSWELLRPWERDALRQLTVFRGGFFLDAAEAVIALSDHPDAPPVASVVSALLSRSLLATQARRGRRRLLLYENVRRFVVRQATDPPEVIRLGNRSVDLGARRVLLRDGTLDLTALEASLLRYLAERGGHTASRSELLAEVWGYAPGAQSRAVDTMVREVRKKIEPDPGAPRWLLSERGEGYVLAVPPRPSSTPASRHAAWFARLGTQESIDSIDARGGLDLAPDAANLHAALASLPPGASSQAAQIAIALLVISRARGPFVASAMLAGRIVHGDGLAETDRIRLLLEQGWAWARAGSVESAVAVFEEARDRAETSGERLLHGRALACLGAQRVSADPVGAAQAFVRATEILCALGDRAWQGRTLLWSASLARARGDVDAAREQLQAARGLFRALGHRGYEGKICANQALLARERGWLDEAEDAAASALAIYEEVGELTSRPNTLINYAWLVSLRRGVGAARPLVEEACALALSLNLPRVHATGLELWGVVDLIEGRTTEGRRRLREVTAAWADLDQREMAQSALAWRALAATLDGELQRGAELAGAVIEEAAGGSELRQGLSLSRVAAALARAGEHQRAQAVWAAAEPLVPADERPVERVEVLAHGAWILARRGDGAHARALRDEARVGMERLRLAADSVHGWLLQAVDQELGAGAADHRPESHQVAPKK